MMLLSTSFTMSICELVYQHKMREAIRQEIERLRQLLKETDYVETTLAHLNYVLRSQASHETNNGQWAIARLEKECELTVSKPQNFAEIAALREERFSRDKVDLMWETCMIPHLTDLEPEIPL